MYSAIMGSDISVTVFVEVLLNVVLDILSLKNIFVDITVHHDILFIKIERYSFRGLMLAWFKSYCSYRTQTVNSPLNVCCGVPQFILMI